jgi:transposase-like protein
MSDRNFARRGRRYKRKFRQRMLRRAQEVGTSQAAREGDCSIQIIYRWAAEEGVQLGGS